MGNKVLHSVLEGVQKEKKSVRLWVPFKFRLWKSNDRRAFHRLDSIPTSRRKDDYSPDTKKVTEWTSTTTEETTLTWTPDTQVPWPVPSSRPHFTCGRLSSNPTYTLTYQVGVIWRNSVLGVRTFCFVLFFVLGENALLQCLRNTIWCSVRMWGQSR